jgi:hypothetical protein
MKLLIYIPLSLVHANLTELWTNPLFWVASTTVSLFGYTVYLKAAEQVITNPHLHESTHSYGFIYFRDLLCQKVQTEMIKSRIALRALLTDLNRLKREQRYLDFQSLPAHLKSDFMYAINTLNESMQTHQQILYRLHNSLEEIGKLSNQYQYRIQVTSAINKIKNRPTQRKTLHLLQDEPEQTYIELLDIIENSVQEILNETFVGVKDEHDFI